MERESFEDATTAALMNRHFVNIKVDREERPDLDALYMQAVMLFTGGHGGWPMTVFLTPKGEPYFGGTYFPPKASRGMPSFTQVLEHAANLYSQRRDDVLAMGREVLEELESLARMPSPHGKLSDGWLESIVTGAAQDFDAEHAGFGGAPKFPPHGTLAALLAAWRRTGDEQALSMATATLDAMAKGGMADLAGGGFARYSVDAEWRIPHFEKMLYDNALLLRLYTDAARALENGGYEATARGIVAWARARMTHPEGGLFASEDADSEGEEGTFYVFSPADVRAAISDEARADLVLAHYGVDEAGNFEKSGKTVLSIQKSVARLSIERGVPPSEVSASLDRAREELRDFREKRPRPFRDEKVLTSWNALFVSALAEAGGCLRRSFVRRRRRGRVRLPRTNVGSRHGGRSRGAPPRVRGRARRPRVLGRLRLPRERRARPLRGHGHATLRRARAPPRRGHPRSVRGRRGGPRAHRGRSRRPARAPERDPRRLRAERRFDGVPRAPPVGGARVHGALCRGGARAVPAHGGARWRTRSASGRPSASSTASCVGRSTWCSWARARTRVRGRSLARCFGSTCRTAPSRGSTRATRGRSRYVPRWPRARRWARCPWRTCAGAARARRRSRPPEALGALLVGT
jgi:hypothetical protein